ncbi:MAG: hypothetical protein COB60_11630 [Flavobacteriaceae bacterium]|nr:MAG: hypothetical protein COB60_11630 [Flavobacteriaceae bacterium]
MKIYLYLATILSFSIISCAQSQKNQIPENEITKILFIGNSYLYYNSATEIFNAMAIEKFPNQKIVTKLISGGGMTLDNHFQNKETLKLLQSEKWDYVVLQEQSELGSGVFIDNTKYYGSMEPFYESARKFHNEIEKVGAKTVFIMTWSDKDNPQKQDYLTFAYTSIAKELNAILIPVGSVWNKERQNNNYDLYSNDDHHPSIFGSYLIASTIFSTLFDSNPSGISGKLTGYSVDEYGNKSFLKSRLSSLSKEDSEAIHTTSWAVVTDLKITNGYPNISSKPKKEYHLPTLPIGSTLNKKELIGIWTGLARFDFVSDGLRIIFTELKNELHITIDIVRDNTNTNTTIVSKTINENRILINFKDENDRVRELKLIKNDDYLRGIIISTQGNYTKYDNIKFSKK